MTTRTRLFLGFVASLVFVAIVAPKASLPTRTDQTASSASFAQRSPGFAAEDSRAAPIDISMGAEQEIVLSRNGRSIITLSGGGFKCAHNSPVSVACKGKNPETATEMNFVVFDPEKLQEHGFNGDPNSLPIDYE